MKIKKVKICEKDEETVFSESEERMDFMNL